MNVFSEKILEEALRLNALQFGDFKLKSGRKSPWFFNAALLNGGKVFEAIGHRYARIIGENWDNGAAFDVIFGPAYKGIPLAAIFSLGFYDVFGLDKPIAYNRKEVKDHGEAGALIGASLKDNRVIIVDDVMTAGTAADESVEIIRAHGGSPVGMVVILDPQEKGKNTTLSAAQQVEKKYGFPVKSILTFADILASAIADNQSPEVIKALEKYRNQYGVG